MKKKFLPIGGEDVLFRETRENDFPKKLLNIFILNKIDTLGIKSNDISTQSKLIYNKDGSKELIYPSVSSTIAINDVPNEYKNCKMVYVCTMEDDVKIDDLKMISKSLIVFEIA